jgi:hypothetical protein
MDDDALYRMGAAAGTNDRAATGMVIFDDLVPPAPIDSD